MQGANAGYSCEALTWHTRHMRLLPDHIHPVPKHMCLLASRIFHHMQDGEVVVHHDCEVKLSIGQETVQLGIPSLTSKQLRRCVHWTHAQCHRCHCIFPLLKGRCSAGHSLGASLLPVCLLAGALAAARSSQPTWGTPHQRSGQTSTSWMHTGVYLHEF